MTPVAQDHPMMIAWKAYEATDHYGRTRNQAVRSGPGAKHEHDLTMVEGALWAAFCEGWKAAKYVEGVQRGEGR